MFLVEKGENIVANLSQLSLHLLPVLPGHCLKYNRIVNPKYEPNWIRMQNFAYLDPNLICNKYLHTSLIFFVAEPCLKTVLLKNVP